MEFHVVLFWYAYKIETSCIFLGYLEEEGLQKTAESFYQECHDNIRVIVLTIKII